MMTALGIIFLLWSFSPLGKHFLWLLFIFYKRKFCFLFLKQLNKSGYINNTDSSILLTLVINIQALQSAYKSLDEVGSVYETKGYIKKNPAVDVVTNTTTKILSASTALGFSPASRASLINLAQVDSEDSAQKLMEMFSDDE